MSIEILQRGVEYPVFSIPLELHNSENEADYLVLAYGELIAVKSDEINLLPGEKCVKRERNITLEFDTTNIVLPKWVNYIAIDNDGNLFAYESKPEFNNHDKRWKPNSDIGDSNFNCFIFNVINYSQELIFKVTK